MRHNQKMTDRELQKAAREAIESTTQTAVAEALGVNRSTVSLALNHDPPSRYAATLRDIVEEYTDYRVETRNVHQVKRKS